MDRIREIIGRHDAQWFDIIELQGESIPISFKNSRIHSINSRESRGYGIRVNVKGRTGFSYTNDIEGFDDMVTRAVSLAGYGEDENFTPPEYSVSGPLFEPYSDSIVTFDISKEMEKGHSVINTILKKFPAASIDLDISRSTGRMRLINSSGADISYKNSYYTYSASVTIISDDSVKLDVWEGSSSLEPESFDYLPDMLIKKIESARIIKKTGSGRIPLLLPPKAAASMLGILTGGLNGKSVFKGTSPFTGKLGEKFFNEAVTIHDSPLLPGSPYSYPFDDEGVKAYDKVLIEKGVITQFVTDLKYAGKMGIPPTGNGSRGYADLPSPSFSNRVMAGGDRPFAEMIKGISLGIMAEQFIGLGQSNTLTGDFSAGLDLAYLIENGEITGRVKDSMITDNLFRLFSGDLVLSSERERRGSVTVPWILFPAVNYTG